MKLYYIANARMPNEKAHGIQIAKMCEAFIEEGIDLTLIVPRRGMSQSLREFYHLRVDIPIARLPSINLYNYERTGYFISSLWFMCTSLVFLWWKRLQGERFVVYTVDLDNYSSSALPFVGAPLFTEMHGGKPDTFAQRFLFRHLRGVFAVNTLIIDEFKKKFPQSLTSYLTEPNGVDFSVFADIDKRDARTRLGLSHDTPIVLYTGRFFEWKGLEILPQAAAANPLVRWQIVGGDRSEFIKLVKAPLPDNLFFAGGRPHKEMPLWFAAADALIVLGTARDIQSYRYTSPMKLFEYLAAGRPIIASNTPAIREIVSEAEVLFYEPDDAQDLARLVQKVVTHSGEFASRVEASVHLAATSSWRARAERIIRFIQESLSASDHDA